MNEQKLLIMEPKISIIIPVYNAEKYLEACLDSLLDQTYTNYEVILINDGSLDSSLSICKKYANKYDRFIVRNQSNSGVDKARNLGLAVSSGEYINFIDSDDYVEPGFLQGFIDALNKYPSSDWLIQGIVIDYISSVHKVSLSEHYYGGKSVLNGFNELEKYYVNGFTVNKLYKRNIIISNQMMFRYTLKEDLLFNLEYCKYVKAMAFVPEEFYHYIQRGESLIHKRYSATFMHDLITSLKDTGLVLASHFESESYRRFVWGDYLLSFSVLIFSMYKRNNGVVDHETRISLIKEYHDIRKKNKDIPIVCSSKSKIIFAKIALGPSAFVDAFLRLLSPLIDKL